MAIDLLRSSEMSFGGPVKNSMLTILVFSLFSVSAMSGEGIAPGAPHCTGVVEHYYRPVPTPQKLTQESANAIGVEIEGYSFKVQYLAYQLWLSIRDVKSNATYNSVLTELKAERKQDLRIRLDNSQLILSCEQ